MNFHGLSTKEIGNLGERVAQEYLRRHGFTILGTNIKSKFGEIDIAARSSTGLHIVEVKSRLKDSLPKADTKLDDPYGPSVNLHRHKINKVARMGVWYVDLVGWEGDWQVDGVTVIFSASEGIARVSYYPQVV